MIIAEAAGVFLEVGLQVKDGVAVLGVPPASPLRKIAQQVLMIAGNEVRQHLVAQAHKQPGVARQVAAVEERHVELEVVTELSAVRSQLSADGSDLSPRRGGAQDDGLGGREDSGFRVLKGRFQI